MRIVKGAKNVVGIKRTGIKITNVMCSIHHVISCALFSEISSIIKVYYLISTEVSIILTEKRKLKSIS